MEVEPGAKNQVHRYQVVGSSGHQRSTGGPRTGTEYSVKGKTAATARPYAQASPQQPQGWRGHPEKVSSMAKVRALKRKHGREGLTVVNRGKPGRRNPLWGSEALGGVALFALGRRGRHRRKRWFHGVRGLSWV